MNKLGFTTGIVVLICTLYAMAATVPRDAALKKLVVGVWGLTFKSPLVTGHGETEYKANGSWRSHGKFNSLGETIILEASGVWSVKGNVVTWAVRKTKNPDLVKVGETHHDTVLEIDARHMKYRDDEGDTFTETKVFDSGKKQPRRPPSRDTPVRTR